MEEIKLLDGSVWNKSDILDHMYNDDFYFDYLGTDKVLSKSSINDLVPPKSPKAWYYDSGKKASAKAFRTGHLFHQAILEPEKYDQVKFSNLKTMTAAGFKKEQSEITETLYTRGEKEFNEKLCAEFTVNKKAMSKLQGARFEVPVIGYIEDLPFRGKIDILTEDGRNVDLKTCGDLKDFPKSAFDYGYDIQAYIYSELMGLEPTKSEFIVISKNTYDIGFFEVDKSFIQQGRMKLLSAIKVYKEIFHEKTDEEIRETLNEISFSQKLTSKDNYYKNR